MNAKTPPTTETVDFTARQPVSRRDALRWGAGFLGAGTTLFPTVSAFSQEKAPATPPPAPASPPPVTSTMLVDRFHVVSGAGGNIAVVASDDGTLLIDSGLSTAVLGTAAEVAKVSPQPLTLLINTHWHFDHTGGNERFANGGARIMAHENSRKRLAEGHYNEFMDRKFEPVAAVARPLVTFNQETKVYWGDETLRLIPVAPAHTDGDVIVRFEKANIVHTGDLFFNGFYPFIDFTSNGWLGGMIEAAKTILGLTDEKTTIIPGHGAIAVQKELKDYLGFLELMMERFSKLQSQSKTVDEVWAAAPTKEFDEILGKGFLNPEKFVRCTYLGLQKHAKK